MIKNVEKLILCVGLTLATFSAQAEIATDHAEYMYDPDTTENEACSLAIKKAINHAISHVLGEYVSAQEILNCRGTTGERADYACEFNRLSWSQIDGHINKTISQKTEFTRRDGINVCSAVVKLDVAIPATKPDPNFQLRATANANLFRVRQKDDIVVDIEVSQPGYYAVFNWQPHIDNSVFYVEMNDKNTKVSTSIKSDKKFTLTPTWSEAYSTRRKFYDEYLIVVVTKRELRWLSKYSYEDFSKALHLIPENEKRVAKIALQLTNE